MTNLLLSPKGRMYAFGIMYLAEGIPYGFATTAMAMHMRMQGLSIEQIGAFVAAVLLPWGFKWAWAPLIDIVKLNRFGYSLALYLDAAFIIAALSVMPFLKNREKKVKSVDGVPVLAQSV